MNRLAIGHRDYTIYHVAFAPEQLRVVTLPQSGIPATTARPFLTQEWYGERGTAPVNSAPRRPFLEAVTPILLSRRSADEILIKARATKSSGDKTWAVTGNMASLPTRSMAPRPFRHPIQKIYCSIRATPWPTAVAVDVRCVF